ncbi:MAG TPA: M56 family metallopeptidase, partial [Gemmataceae bacterium]|nr:M56 family metallopeptidase [Gemmataceae bacterium]
MQTIIRILPSLTDLATAPSEVMLIAKCTILLAVAWAVHGLLAGRNPRARVLLWRATLVGVVALPMLACLPPLLTWRLPDLEQPFSTAVPESTPSTGQPPLASVVEEATPKISEPFPEAATTIRSSLDPTAPTSPHESTGDEASTGQSIQTPASLSVRAWLWIVWASGVVFLAARLIWSHTKLARLITRSRAAPNQIQQACQVVADRLGCRRALGVLVSDEIASPCLAGILHPTVLLPEPVCQSTDHDDLQAILAHESAHVRGGDLVWSIAAHSISILLWFNPLAWRIRAAHAGACEAVCDAVAADLLNDVPGYSRTLARLALQIAPAPSSAGLAMARVSHVRRRILALSRRLFRAPLRRLQVVPALCLGAVLLEAIGSVGFAGPEMIASPTATLATNEEQPQPQPVRKLHGRVVLPDGTPAAGIEVGLGTVHVPIALEASRLPRDGKFPRATTAADGTFSIDSSAARSVLITSGEAGYGSVILAPESVEIKNGKVVLQPWSKIAGQVILAGKPVPDHEVVYLPGSGYLRREGSVRNFFTDSEYKVNTDKEGRFVFERVPPGGGVAHLPIVTELGGGKTQRLRCWPLAFRMVPGATAEIKLGATGRTIVGKVVLNGNPKVHIDWTKNKPV